MKQFRTCFRALMQRLRPIRWKILVIVLAGLVLVAASLAFVWISKRVVDIATGQAEASLGRGVVLMCGIMLVQLGVRVFLRWWEGYVVVQAQNRARQATFDHVMRSSWSGQERFHSGDTVNRIEEDIRVVTDFLCRSLPDCLVTVVQLVAASAFLFALSPSLAWILVFIMPVAVLGSRLFFRRMRALTGEIRTLDSRIQGHIQEKLQHRILIRSLQGIGGVVSRLAGLQGEVQDKTVTRLNYGAVSQGFMGLGFMVGYALAFFWGVFGLRDGTVTYGLMVAFLQLVGQVQRPVAEIARHIPAFIRALSSEERLLELEELPLEEEGSDIALPGAPGIRIEDLGFAYPGQPEPVLSQLDFDFRPGSMTVIEGETGAGKSTLIRLMMSLLKPTSGRIVLYDPEVESSSRTLCNFMYVPQGNSLMSGTIRQNLLLADPAADEERLREALHLAAADFVFSLPDGLDTVCAEVGSGLSEGQAQRIAIARALLRPGGILVLDEATSALDAETEKTLLERLRTHCRGGKTVVCVTHRPAAAAYADAVLRL